MCKPDINTEASALAQGKPLASKPTKRWQASRRPAGQIWK